MTEAQGRALALSAARYQLRRLQCDVLQASALMAHQALDDYARLYRNMAASQWYHGASDAQMSLFYRDWRRWQCKMQSM